MLNNPAIKQAFYGKTIKSIDVSSSNMWEFEFTDGTKMGVWGEVESNNGLPFLYAEAVDPPVNSK